MTYNYDRRGAVRRLPTALPMTRDEFIPVDDPWRDEKTGDIMVPPATEVAHDVSAYLQRNPATKGLRAKAKDGAVNIMEGEDILAVIAKRPGTGRNELFFEVAPREPDDVVNRMILNALDMVQHNFRPWNQQGRSVHG